MKENDVAPTYILIVNNFADGRVQTYFAYNN
jgi:hypothetical protein